MTFVFGFCQHLFTNNNSTFYERESYKILLLIYIYIYTFNQSKVVGLPPSLPFLSLPSPPPSCQSNFFSTESILAKSSQIFTKFSGKLPVGV